MSSVIVLACLWCRGAAGQASDGLVLEWQAPESCPDAGAVVERLRAVLDDAPEAQASTRVRGRVTRQSSQWLLQLEMFEQGERLTRLIQAKNCEDLAEAAAIALALAFGRELPPQVTPPAPPQPDAAEVTTANPIAFDNRQAPRADGGADPSVTKAAPPKASSRIGFSVAAGATLDVNSLPDPSPGLSLEGRAHLNSLALGLYGVLVPGSDVSLQRTGAVSFGLLTAGARGCYRAWTDAAGMAGCVGFEAGQFHATGVELTTSRRVDDWWLAPNLALEIGTRLFGSLQAQMRSEMLLPLVRKHYVVDGIDDVFQPPGLALRFYVGLALAAD